MCRTRHFNDKLEVFHVWRVPLHSVLHPIVQASSGQVIGHEALLRGPTSSAWESPAQLFAEADRQGDRVSLEQAARRLAVSRLPDLPSHQSLFVNIDPVVAPAVPPIPAPPDRVVLEIAETRPIGDDQALRSQIDAWRLQGHRIAIDDYGAGYMGVKTLLALEPDIVKIDQAVIRGLDHHPARRAAVEAIMHVTQAIGPILVIAEGVETPEEFWALQDCGVDYMQGYLFGKPQESPIRDVVSVLPTRTRPDASTSREHRN